MLVYVKECHIITAKIRKRENSKSLVIICYYYKYIRMITLLRDDSNSMTESSWLGNLQ